MSKHSEALMLPFKCATLGLMSLFLSSFSAFEPKCEGQWTRPQMARTVILEVDCQNPTGFDVLLMDTLGPSVIFRLLGSDYGQKNTFTFNLPPELWDRGTIVLQKRN